MKLTRIWVIGLAMVLAGANLAAAQERPKRPAPPTLPEGVRTLRDLQYVEGGHQRNRLDLYLPEKAEGRLPLVVWIHGGGWWAGSKEGCPAVPLVAKGYAAASINYRFSQHAVFPAQIEDCKAAIRWLRANAAKYHLDPDHIGVWGARPEAISSPCSEPPAESRSGIARAGTSISRAACSASLTGTAPRTWRTWANRRTSRARPWRSSSAALCKPTWRRPAKPVR